MDDKCKTGCPPMGRKKVSMRKRKVHFAMNMWFSLCGLEFFIARHGTRNGGKVTCKRCISIIKKANAAIAKATEGVE